MHLLIRVELRAELPRHRRLLEVAILRNSPARQLPPLAILLRLSLRAFIGALNSHAVRRLLLPYCTGSNDLRWVARGPLFTMPASPSAPVVPPLIRILEGLLLLRGEVLL